MSKSTAVKSAISLKEFARKEGHKGCVICQLPADVRAELAGTDVPWRIRVKWLEEVHGVSASPQMGISHVNGRHQG